MVQETEESNESMMGHLANEFARELCCLSILWDMATVGKFRAKSSLFYAVNQDHAFEALTQALEILEASFSFCGLHDNSTQCRVQIFSLHSLWAEYEHMEMFDFYLRQGWSTEGRRESMILMAVGKMPDRCLHPDVEPLWELRHDPEHRVYDKPIYRMVSKKEYLDDFFTTGRLRITTLESCKKHEGLQGDRKEGEAVVLSVRPDGTTIFTWYDVGADAYILCGAVEDTLRIRQDFHAEGAGAILIKDPYRFGLAVGATIPYVTHGIAGYCDYRESRIHYLPDESVKARMHASIDFAKGKGVERFREVMPGDEVFLKEKELYEHQQEFRFAWFIKEPIQGDHVFINCPKDAVDDYCERIDF